MSYIKIPKVYKKFKKAEELFSPVIMTAATGWGKNAAVDYYYRRKNPLVLGCREGHLMEMPDPDSFRSSVVVIDDMQWLFEEESIRYLKKLLRVPGIQVIMLTRGGVVPKYLAAEEMDLGFVRITENDLAFTEKEVQAYFDEREIPIDPEDVGSVLKASKGYVRAIFFYATRMEDGSRFSSDMEAAVIQDIYRLWDGQVYDQWLDDFVHFCLCVCRYDEFTLEMAEYLTGNKNISKVIEYCRDNTNQLEIRASGYYAIRREMKGYYRWKQELVWSEAQKLENFRRAANYYEMKGEIENALMYYQKAGDTQRVKELLIRDANTHPGTGHYVQSREYYFSLPKEDILASPVLMAGMSMLYSLILMPEKSEEWYDALDAFYRDKSNSRERRREAGARLAYLDIGLPHRGTKGLMGIMKNVFTMMQKGDIVLPEFSATGNMPSIMNGGLDFCQWSKNDVQIARFMGRSVAAIIGDFGKGFVTLCLAESGFEKGTMPAYEVLTRCSDGYDAASHGGKIEMCFVSLGIQIRQHMVEGQLPSAKRILESFEEKVRNQGADHLLPNLYALKTWMSLFVGADEKVLGYIEEVSDARVFFCVADRYRQSVKIRCLVAFDRLEEAFDLATFLTGYYESYDRTFMWMENEVLKSIILYRMGDEHWRNHLHGALLRSEEYRFIRLFSLEGAALLPLLKQVKDEGGFSDVDEEHFDRIYEECIRVATGFPDYLKRIKRENISLTARESQVLSMLCAGMSSEEICGTLGISYDGLKKHNKNLYKKLDVKNRAEAERKATQLGLVHRG